MNELTGEIVAEKGTLITAEIADAIQNSGAPFVWVEERMSPAISRFCLI